MRQLAADAKVDGSLFMAKLKEKNESEVNGARAP